MEKNNYSGKLTMKDNGKLNIKTSITVVGTNTEPPKPSKDKVVREHSWLETLTFGLYKTKKIHKKG